MAKTQTGNEVSEWDTERGAIMNADEALQLIVRNNIKTLDDFYTKIDLRSGLAQPQKINKSQYIEYKNAVKAYNQLTDMNQRILNTLYADRKQTWVKRLHLNVIDQGTCTTDEYSSDWYECNIVERRE